MQPTNNFIKLLVLTLCLLGVPVHSSRAFDWTANNLQLLYGNTFRLGASEKATVTVEHSDGWRYGNNFFFVDIAERPNAGVEVYAEVYSYLSMKKLSGHEWAFGPIKDISLSGGLNIGNKPENDNFQAYLLGLSFNLANEIFNYLQLDVFAYKNDDVNGKYGLQITPVWSVPFEIVRLKFKFRGFADFNTGNSNTSGHFHILSQPQLLLDIGDLAGLPGDKIYVGTEYSIWHNKFGIQGVNESVIQAMVIGYF